MGLVVDDLVDHGSWGGFGLLAGQVHAGDLQAVEEQAGAARVDVVGGDALQDLAEGELESGAVVWPGEVEGAETGLASGGVLYRLAVGVVEVAELLVAEARAAAAAACSKDVAALLAVVVFLIAVAAAAVFCVRHLGTLPRVFGCKILRNIGLGLYPHRYKTMAPTESSGSGAYARLRFLLLISLYMGCQAFLG